MNYALRFFPSLEEARAYRHEHGTGGWIFAPDEEREETVLFPPEITPSAIFHHPATRGRSGRLVGSQ